MPRDSGLLSVFAALVLSLSWAPSPARAADYSFTRIVVPGSSATFARGINDAGDIVGQFSTGGVIHGFKLANGIYTAIDYPGARFTVATAINNAGQIVGLFGFSDGDQHGFRRDPNGTYVVVDVPGVGFTEPRGITSDGRIAGWFARDPADPTDLGHGFLLSGGSFTTLNAPDALNTFIYGINDAGTMVGGDQFESGVIHGLLVAAGAFSTFDPPGAAATFPYGISGAGQIAGMFRDAGVKNHGFVRDTNGRFKTVDPPGSVGTEIHGINRGGKIVGWYYDGVGIPSFVGSPSGDCTSQITVNAFDAITIPGLRSVIDQGELSLFTEHGPRGALLRNLGAPGTAPVSVSQSGIEFQADVSIADGPIPVDEIHLRFIQNQTAESGAVVYFPAPNRVPVLVGGAEFPLLDTDHGGPPPILYDANFIETDPAGPDRIVEAKDSPSLRKIDLTRTTSEHGIQRLQSIDVTSAFTMFLVCYDDQDPTYRSVQALDWSVHYSGSVHPRPLAFVQSADAGITAQASRPESGTPRIDGPAAVDGVDFVWEDEAP